MNLNDLSFEEVKILANSVEGFSFHHMTGEVKLKEDLATYLEANPDKIPDVPDVPENDKIEEDLVKIQSDYRGEIASSFGMLNFGTDGVCEVSEEAAKMLCELKGYERC